MKKQWSGTVLKLNIKIWDTGEKISFAIKTDLENECF